MLQRFLQQLKDPMLIILMIAAVVSRATTRLHNMQNPENPEGLAEVFIILIVVLLNAILGWQQHTIAIALAVTVIPIVEWVKFIQRRLGK